MSNSNYTVSALKYRPNSWDTIIGQENIAITLKQAIDSNQLAQAYLFCGPRGVGKTSTARLFAKSINLKHDPNLTDFTYNIYELDAASNNQVDDIRNLNDQVRIPPQIGNYKVYVIDEVHMLSQSAFNAFLKTLEEPPPHAIFILAADGALRDALSCFDLMVNFTNSNITYKEVIKNLNILDYDYYFKFADFIHKNLIHESLLLFSEIISKGFDGRLFINGLASHFRNLMIAKDERTLKILEYTKDTIEKFKIQAELFDNEYLTDLLSLTNEADSFYKTSQNQRLLVEILIMKLCSSRAEKKKLNFLEAPIIAPDFKDSKLIPSSKDVENQSSKEIIESNEKYPPPKTYEPEKSEIIRPKTSLSIKKRSVAASISGLRQQINQESIAKNEDGGVEVLASSKFSQKLLEEKWNEFAEIKNKEGKIGLFTTLTKQTPELLDDFLIKFILDSEVQKMEFQSQNQLLLDFLRAELKNGHIQLVLELTKSDNPKLTQLTSKQRFFQMAEKNPDLHIFQEKFNLDLEF